MTSELAMISHWSVRQKLNRVSSVQFSYIALYALLGLTEEEAEEKRLWELERLMQSEVEQREERDRVAAEEALLKARRQQEWVSAL